MLKFASICPHPPIIIPTIGNTEDLKKVSKTIEEYKNLAKIFQKAKIETIIVISPHGPVEYSQFSLTISPVLKGNFGNFGDFETEFEFENDLEIVDLIKDNCKLKKIPYRLLDFPQLDHGVLVPLYYLTKKYEKPLKIVPLAYSFLGVKTNFEFGKILYEICNVKNKTKKRRIGIIASGDLSHRLSFSAPAGFSPFGKVFDTKLIELLEKNDINGILNMDPQLIENAGECGYLSIAILSGAVSKKGKFQILSYESPFGVGYLLVRVRL